MTASLRRELVVAALLGVAFFLLASFSMRFAREAGQLAAIWPANALLLVALLRAPGGDRRLRLAGGWLGNLAAGLAAGAPAPLVLFLASTSTVETLICLYVVIGAVGGTVELTRPRHLTVFMLAALLSGPLVGGLAVATFLAAQGHAGFLPTLLTWWPTHALGLLVFSPALLILSDGSVLKLFESAARRRTVAIMATLALGLGVVFFQSRFPLLFIVPPILVLATFQLSLAGAAMGILLTAGVSIAALALGLGPTTLVGAPFVDRLQMLEVFLTFLVVATLPLASVLEVRRQLEDSLLAVSRSAENAATRLAEANAVAAMAERMGGLGYWRYRPGSRELVWSDEMYRIYGLPSATTAPGFEAVVACYHPDDRQSVRDLTLRSLKTGLDYGRELRIVRDGEVRRVVAHTSCQHAPDGSVAAVIGTILDVTEMRRVEAALVESEARHRTLAEAVPDLILRVSPENIITYASPACRQLGYAPEDLVGHRTFEFIHPDDIATAADRSAAIASGERLDPDIRREQRVRTKDGGWVWLEGKPSQVRDADGAVVEMVNALRDVTRRRALEDELVDARRAAERSNVAKADFLSNMSHELRTPLTAIIGFTGLLTGTGKLGEREAMFAQRVAGASASLLTLVNDILDFSKLEAGGVDLEADEIDLAVLVEQSLALVSGLAEKKGLVVATALGADLPTILGDHGRLRQMLVNLLGNAVKFTAAGRIDLHVMAARGGGVRFEIRDTGSGIPADRLEQIFDRFTQADGSTTRTHGGTGLGLSICKGLVDAMGGTLSVDSQVGIGSTFAFTAPRAPAAPAVTTAAA